MTAREYHEAVFNTFDVHDLPRLGIAVFMQLTRGLLASRPMSPRQSRV